MLKKIFCAILSVLLLGAVWTITGGSEFKALNGKSRFYFYNASSLADSVKSDEFLPAAYLLRTGESVFIDKYVDYSKIFLKYDAELCFTEELEEGVSYYGFSKELKYKKQINGKIINLHVFVGKNYTVVGTPIIYGGY